MLGVLSSCSVLYTCWQELFVLDLFRFLAFLEWCGRMLSLCTVSGLAGNFFGMYNIIDIAASLVQAQSDGPMLLSKAIYIRKARTLVRDTFLYNKGPW